MTDFHFARVAGTASLFLLLTAAAGPLPAQVAAPAPALQELRTPLEASDFQRHTRYPEMVEYLHAVRARSVDMSLGSYGRSREGRELHYALYSRPAVRSPAEAHASGKPVLVLGANAHGHNHTLREALLVLLRDFGRRGTELNDLLDHVVVLVVPSKNPDGLAAETRINAAGADLNRDYIALEQPETAAYVGNVINRWHPHLFVDGHNGGAVQYGGAYPYDLLYQGTGTAGADPSLSALADEKIFPLIDRRFEAAGYRSFYWARGDGERWYGGGSAPRMGRNYGGLANKLTILFESADWPDTRTAVASGVLAYRTVLEYARDNGDELIATVLEARRRTIELGERAEGQIPVEESLQAEDFRVTYQIRHPDDAGGERSPADDRPARPGDPLLTVRDAEIMKKATGTRFRDRPYAYLLPAEAAEAVRLLRRHNVAVERLTEPVALDLQVYVLEDVRHESGVNGHATAVRVDVGDMRAERVEMPAGAWVVRTGQLLGRVVTQLLEPESSDNVVYWNAMTTLLPLADLQAHRNDPARHDAPLVPIFKLMHARPLPAVLVR